MNTKTLYLTFVTDYVDRILNTRPVDSNNQTLPLFPDGIECSTKSYMTWPLPSGQVCQPSNLASEQNLLRILYGLSKLTNNQDYYDIAQSCVKYYFDHLQDATGLLHWGGHRFLDLTTLHPTNIEGKKGIIHELKNCLPFYKLLFETNPQATVRLIHGIWNAHVNDFSTLSINRHGYFIQKPSKLWASSFDPLPPFFQSKGLSFINIGNDLIYSAGSLFLLAREKGALVWMKRLAKQYVKARNIETNLGAYQYTQALKKANTSDSSLTTSEYGDRALRQLGPELGSNVLEGHVLLANQATSIYYHNAIMSLKLGHQLGALGNFLIEDAKSGLKAYAKYAYNADSNTFKPLLTDGTDLTGFKLMRSGYYGQAGETFSPFTAHEGFLYAYIEAYSHTKDELLWQTARQIALGLNLGDLGKTIGVEVNVNLNTSVHSEQALFALIRLIEISNCDAYKKLAITIADNLINTHYIDGYFVSSSNSKYISLDSPMPLALLMLDGVLSNRLDLVPTYMTSSGYIHGNYRMPDGTIKPYTTDKLLEELV